MKLIGIRIFPWDRVRELPLEERADVRAGSKVLVESEIGQDVGQVIYVLEPDPKDAVATAGDSLGNKIIRSLSVDEQSLWQSWQDREEDLLRSCRERIKTRALPMKLVGAQYSFDGSRILFAFTAEDRVDFRDLVRDLTRLFQRRVRLQQIGSRDEARERGGVGHCGQAVCCRRFLKDMKSISTDMAAEQELAHRGSERLSGICGRLMCCLAYEKDFYNETNRFFPAKGDIVYDKVHKKEGVVAERKFLTGKVLVTIDDDQRIEVPLDQIKIVKRNTPSVPLKK